MAGRFTLEAIFKGTDRFSTMLGAIETRTGRFARNMGGALSEANGAIDRFASGLKSVALVGGAMGAAVGVGLLKIGTAGAAFEHQMTTVGAVMSKSRAQIADLEKEAMSLGVSTQFSSTEVGEAMEMLARKGFTANEIFGATPGVLNAIAASGEGMAEVSTVVASSIRGFGLEASKAAHVADVLAFTSQRVGAHITDLGTALAIAAPTAKALGVSIEDTTAAVGLLQKIGLDPSTAGTATATMLAKISKPSKEAATQMAAMGVSFQDATGNMLPFRDVLGQFAKAGDKAGGNMKRMAFLAELVGLRGDKAALALSDMAKSGEFDALTTGLQHVDGAAAKMAGLNLDDSVGSWKLLTSTVEVLEDQLWKFNGSALRGVVDSTNQWLQANQALIVSGVNDYIDHARFGVEMFTHGVRDGFGALRDGLGDVGGPLGGIAKLFDRFPSWPVAIRDVGFAIGTVGPVALAVAAGVKTATVAVAVFNAVTKANPYMLAAGGLIALGTAFVVYRPEIDAFASRHKVLLGVIAGGATIIAGVWAWTNAWKGAVLLLEIGQKGVAAATWIANGATTAWAGAMRIASAADTLFTGEITATAVATDGAAASFAAADLALGPLVLTLGAAAAAMGSLVAVYTQWQGLEQASGGHVWEGVKGVFSGKGFFAGVDDAENEDARKKYAAEHPAGGTGTGTGTGVAPGSGATPPGVTPPPLPPGVAPPPGSEPPQPPQVVGAASAMDPATLMRLIEALEKQQSQKLEIDVKAADGAKVDVKQPNAGSKRPISVRNSGGLAR